MRVGTLGRGGGHHENWEAVLGLAAVGPPMEAIEGKGPQMRPQKQFDGRLEEVDGRLEEVDGRLEEVDGRLEAVAKAVGAFTIGNKCH